MTGEFDVIVIGSGTHGPFKDDAHPEDRSLDRSYSYTSLASVDGSGSSNVTHAPEMAAWAPKLFTPQRVKIEIRPNGKLRLHGPVAAVAA